MLTALFLDRGLAITEESDDEEMVETRLELRIERALRVTGDQALAVELKRETYDEGWEDDPGSLNGFAWWCFENELNLQEAEELARRGVALSLSDTQRAQILDTVAEIVHLRGDTAGALELIEQARALDAENDYYEEQLRRFTEAVAATASGTGPASD